MIETYIIEQTVSYRPVAHELEDKLKLIQETWGYKVINVFETRLNERPLGTNQGFIILYEKPEVTVTTLSDTTTVILRPNCGAQMVKGEE